jgi:U3 small nucleolar RNA-associated protein MPP10
VDVREDGAGQEQQAEAGDDVNDADTDSFAGGSSEAEELDDDESAFEADREYDKDSLLDDANFKMGEMEAFAEKLELDVQRELDDAEGHEEKRRDDDEEDSYESDSGGKFELLYAPLDQSDNEEDVAYEDFFVAKPKSAAAAAPNPSSSKPSKLQLQRVEMAKRIAELEEAALAEKPWQLRGETVAKTRPTDSLLEQGDLDVAFAKRAAPVLTKEAAEAIEDVIKRRIEEAKYDDVQPAPVYDLADPSKLAAVSLSVDKSREGLGDVYAQDYEERVLKHVPQAVLDKDKEHEEIREMYAAVSRKLDALSNFHYTPKPPPSVPHAATRDVAAVLMEDVIPTTEAGDLSQAAPEQANAPLKGLGKSHAELEPHERRALRNASKTARRKQRTADGTLPAVQDKRSSVKRLKATQQGDGEQVKWGNSAQVFAKLAGEKKPVRAA